MARRTRPIDVDAQVADLLEARAAARGMTVSDLLADIAGQPSLLSEELAAWRGEQRGPWAPDVLAEDERRLADFRTARCGVPWDDMRTWLESWGTPEERPVPMPRRL